MWFDGWHGIARVLLVGTGAYVSLVLLLRVSGKRTLTKLNAFDLVVTVALGSTLATVLLSKDVAALEGLAAFCVLIGGQLVITWLSVRSALVRKIVKSEPRLLLWQGKPLEADMKRERITLAELESSVRSSGLDSLSDAAAVVLETDGSLHVLQRAHPDGSALRHVRGLHGRRTSPGSSPSAPHSGLSE